MDSRLAIAVAVLAAALVAGSLASAATNNISTSAGTGAQGGGGDGGAATGAELNLPIAVSATPDGGYLIADQGNQRVRKVSSTGVISTVAGTGTAGYNGDGIPAAQHHQRPHRGA